jgi:hypothetical protein
MDRDVLLLMLGIAAIVAAVVVAIAVAIGGAPTQSGVPL